MHNFTLAAVLKKWYKLKVKSLDFSVERQMASYVKISIDQKIDVKVIVIFSKRTEQAFCHLNKA